MHQPHHDPDIRTAFFLSDGTGITVETFGKSLLAQFDTKVRHIRIPFVDNAEKVQKAIEQINAIAEISHQRPIVFATLVQPELIAKVQADAHAKVMDLFSMFVSPLEEEFGIKSHHRVGRFSDVTKSQSYRDRIEAINYSLMHDDGQTNQNLDKADVILIGVSRSGKTPTSLYLAMQHGLKVANYPLIPEDFERQELPPALLPYKQKLFGLTIKPERLSEIRNERRPGSRYAELANCRMEVSEAENMMRRSGVHWLSTTSKSIEEISATILQDLMPEYDV